MRKALEMGVTVISLLAGIIVSPMLVNANDTTKGTGTVEFESDTGEDIVGLIKPGTEREYIWTFEEGAHTTGGLRFSNVPNISFGKVKISAGASNRYPAKISNYQPSQDGKVPTGDPANKLKIPQFVQVVDGRGGTGQFEVKVSATPFTSNGKPDLVNTKIELYSAVVRNNVLDKVLADSDARELLLTPGIVNGEAKIIPTDKTNGISILKVAAGKSANASISSVVFDKDYTSTTDYSNKDTNDQIQLYVPNGEQPLKDVKYTSTLNWELIDSI